MIPVTSMQAITSQVEISLDPDRLACQKPADQYLHCLCAKHDIVVIELNRCPLMSHF